MKIKKYAEFIYEKNSIDNILDKINKVGYKNLTSFDKEILSKSETSSNIEDDIIKWLNSNYSNLNIFEEKRMSFGKVKEFIIFLDDDMEMQFEYDKTYKTLYISYDDIVKNLGENFNEKEFKKWFKNNYDIDVIKINNYFKNI